MTIGKYKISVINTAMFGLDGGAMFGIIPKPLWNKTVESDKNNRIKLGSNCLFLESDSKKILIDTGIGNGWEQKFEVIYNLNYKDSSLEKSLIEKRINPNDITDVILTHLHFDHVGGAVKYENDKILPMFPNATYHVQNKHFEWAKNPSPKDKGSFVASRFLPLMNEGILNLIDGDIQFDDEISLITSDGHTIAQQLVKIADGNNTIFYAGDIIPTSAHIPIPYIMGYDIQPLVTIEEKIKLLSQAVDEEWKIIFEHDCLCLGATIGKNENGFAIKERIRDLK